MLAQFIYIFAREEYGTENIFISKLSPLIKKQLFQTGWF